MPKPSTEIISTQQMRRIFLQLGAADPGNPLQFAGLNAQYMMIDSVTRPLRTIDPIKLYNPSLPKRFQNVGRKISAPDFPTATLHLLETRGTLPFQLGDMSCPFNLYIPVGLCKDLSDFLSGWSDQVEIISFAEATSVDEGARNAWEADEQVEDAVSITLQSKYSIGPVSFSNEATTQVDREVIDIVYGGGLQCGDCGLQDDGTKKVYFVTKSSGAASPGLPAEVTYSIDGGVTWLSAGIDGFGATEDPVAIDIVGNKIVVVGSGAYFWATLTRAGVPGAFTKVSTGFVAGAAPNDLFVLSAQEIFFVGNGGYIYKSTDITTGVSVIDAASATTQNLLRISGDNQQTLVAVGAASTVLKSTNRGQNWATTVANPSAIALDVYAVAVKSTDVYFVGTGLSGRKFYTLDGGTTWIEQTFTGSGAGYVRDIVFATDEVGWFVHDDNTPTGRLWSTWDGGNSWVRDDGGSPRLLNWPVIDRINRIATPNATLQVAGNWVALGGLAGDGTDGIALIGAPNQV